MKINEHEAILTPRVLLVPYCAHHVPTYHEWMKDEEIQQATASEPLTLEEEYAMQQSWRLDHDKLTFIICYAPSSTVTTQSSSSQAATAGVAAEEKEGSIPQLTHITPQKDDSPSQMIGDINLFLYEDDNDNDEESDSNSNSNTNTKKEQKEDPPKGSTPLIGELEIMLAHPPSRRQGLARISLQTFLSYISSSLDAILEEYRSGSDEKSERYLRYLRVKIKKENERSVGLFGRVGFELVGGGEANYFGEVEMRLGMGGKGWNKQVEEVGRAIGYGGSLN